METESARRFAVKNEAYGRILRKIFAIAKDLEVSVAKDLKGLDEKDGGGAEDLPTRTGTPVR